MATIDSVKFYMSRTASRTGWNIYCSIRAVAVYTSDPGNSVILGTSDAVLVDNVPLHGSQDWIEFTFSTPVDIGSSGFYVVQIWGSTSNYQVAGVRVYDSTVWSDATGGTPYSGKERGWRYKDGSWASGITPAYQVICTDNDGNSAITPTTTYDTLGEYDATDKGGTGVRSYLEVAALPGQPTTPTPENNDTGVDFSDLTLSWVDGGDTETFNVYIGETGALIPVSTAQTGVSYVTTLSELETIFGASPIDQKIYWRIDAVNEAGTTTGDEWNFDPRPAQATVPSPAHEAADVELSTTPLSYIVGDPVDIRLKIQGGVYTEIAEDKDVLSWRTPYVILNIKDYNPASATGYRSPVAGDVIYDDTDSYTITYVVVGDLINVQYQAKLYAFRTTGPGGKNPGDVLTNGVAPDVEDPQAVRVTLNDQWHFHGDVGQIYLPPSTTFVWRVDATNDFGTTTGIEWEFTTPTFKYIKTSYVLIAGGSGVGPHDYPPGEEGTDWAWTGENNMVSIRRLVAAADNKIWVEDI